MPTTPASQSASDSDSVFLNIPYDAQFEKLCLAYIAGVTAFGLAPHATLEIPGGSSRLDRIFDLIRSCGHSVHDLSRVQLDRHSPRTPRFNMPFELGLAVAWERLNHSHTWYICEKVDRRLQKSLSDLNGTDVYVHGGTVHGVFRELCSAFVRRTNAPTIDDMDFIYRDLRHTLPTIMQRAGSTTPFTARVFTDLCLRARATHNRGH